MNMQTQDELQGRRIGVLGGGITGLTAAYYLLRSGADVTIFESRPQLAGYRPTSTSDHSGGTSSITAF